jgi:hypothetical protein
VPTALVANRSRFSLTNIYLLNSNNYYYFLFYNHKDAGAYVTNQSSKDVENNSDTYNFDNKKIIYYIYSYYTSLRAAHYQVIATQVFCLLIDGMKRFLLYRNNTSQSEASTTLVMLVKQSSELATFISLVLYLYNNSLANFSTPDTAGHTTHTICIETHRSLHSSL